MQSTDLIREAERLCGLSKNRPRQVYLQRAVSSLYYALFHALTRHCADKLVGAEKSRRSNEAWRQTYRALNHGVCKNKMDNKAMMAKFPNGILNFSETFILLQERRNEADYDPFRKFAKEEVLAYVERAKATIAELKDVPNLDLRAFAIYLLLKPLPKTSD